MQLLCSSIGTAAVATIYVIYGCYRDHVFQSRIRGQLLRQRVTYMLWVMADQVH